MYFFDPVAGRRRRSLIRDQLISLNHDLQDFLDKGVRDLQNKTKGLFAEVGHSLAGAPADSDILAERVRSVMGRYVANPHAIEVSVSDGHVVLKGAIRSEEVHPFVRAVQNVRGVIVVENELDVRESADRNLSGQSRQRGGLDQNWSPATRLLASAGGGLLMLNCLAKRSPGAILIGTVGFGLFVRAVANRPLPVMLDEVARSPSKDSRLHKNRLTANV
jgi:hypothetical protein